MLQPVVPRRRIFAQCFTQPDVGVARAAGPGALEREIGKVVEQGAVERETASAPRIRAFRRVRRGAKSHDTLASPSIHFVNVAASALFCNCASVSPLQPQASMAERIWDGAGASTQTGGLLSCMGITIDRA